MKQGSSRNLRMSEQRGAYEQKRKITDQVKVRFARFGDETLSLILAYALHPKRMTLLLQHISVQKQPRNLEGQFDAIWKFLATFGNAEFIKRIKGLKVKNVEAATLEEWEEGSEGEPEAEGEAASTENEGAAIDSPGYKGPERRSGKDQRVQTDRRGDIEAIEKNKRFGGDRRKRRRGRRKSDKT